MWLQTSYPVACLPELKTISTVEPWWKEEILAKYAKADRVVAMLHDPKNTQKESMYAFLGDMNFYKNYLYLVPNSKFKERVLIECHSSPDIGHVDDEVFKLTINCRCVF